MIAFDYGGVIEVSEKDFGQEMANILQVTKEDWLRVYYSLNYIWNTRGDNGEDVLTSVAREFNASDAQISQMLNFIKENKETKKINLELIEIIKDLKRQNYKISILSNNSIKLKQKLIDQNLMHLFDDVIVSAEVGYQKPQPEIFKILLNNFNIKSEELVFIDDSKKSLEGAEEIGYVPLLFSTNEQLKKDLSDLLS